MQVGSVTDSAGYCHAVLPGRNKSVKYFSTSISFQYLGFNGSTVPRLGDGAVSSAVHGSQRRAGLEDVGCPSLFRGGPDIGTIRVVDSGRKHC